MRLGVLVGEDQKGVWHALALPGESIANQKRLMKAIKGADGETKKHGRLKRVMFFDSYRKRARFLDPEVIAERAKRVADAAKAKEKSERGARNAEEKAKEAKEKSERGARNAEAKPEAGANKPK